MPVLEPTLPSTHTPEVEALLNFGIWEYDFDADIFHWSKGMYLLFGYDPDTFSEIINGDFYYRHFTDETKTISDRKRQDVINSKENSYNWTFEIMSNDGKLKKLETHSRVIRDDRGKPVKYLGTTRDITELSTYEKNLEKTINELNRSNKELEEFAYVASHDLQEPLRKLSTFTERLTSRYGDRLDDDGKMYTERIIAATNNMRSLIENLLEFSRVARSSAAFELVDLNEVLKQCIQDNELGIEETGTQVKVDDLPTIAGIRSQMLQLFNNLITNAIKFRKKDEQQVIEISSTTTPINVKNTHTLPTTQNFFTIEVKDKGIGFEQEYAERIFQIFQRLHGKAEYPGTGVGLAICKKIVDNHKGVIYAEGKPGEGAIFTIIIPQ